MGIFIDTLPLPTNMNVVATESKGFFIVIFDAKLIFSVLETIFGSSNTTKKQKVEGREFTKIEFNVIKKLIDIVCVQRWKKPGTGIRDFLQILSLRDQPELRNNDYQ